MDDDWARRRLDDKGHGVTHPTASPGAPATHYDEPEHLVSAEAVLIFFIVVSVAAVLVGVYKQKKAEWAGRRRGAAAPSSSGGEDYHAHQEYASAGPVGSDVEMSMFPSTGKIKSLFASAGASLGAGKRARAAAAALRGNSVMADRLIDGSSELLHGGDE